MQTPHRDVATTGVAGVPPAHAKKLQPARLPLQLDRRAAIAATTDGGTTSTITDHAGVTVSVAESDALSGSAYSSAWALAVE
jgi:hypothetical protein